MYCPPHPLLWFNYPNNIQWRIQAMKFIIMQFAPLSVFLPFMSKYLPQQSVLKNLQSVFLPQSERPSFVPIQYNWQNCSCTVWVVSVVPKYLNFVTFSNDSLGVLIFWFCLEFW
jgi:hypothetical protein